MGTLRLMSIIIILSLTVACEQLVGFGEALEDASDAIDFSDGGSSGGSGENQEEEELGPLEYINTLCENSNKTVTTLQVDFPNPGYTCEWGQNGNLMPLNLFFQARIEKEVILDLPESAVLCDAQFEFARQEFRYDDHFLFLFNDTVMAASYDFTDVLAQEPASGLYIYDWNNIVGMNWDQNKETVYCAQFENYVTSCDFPGHDTQGFIELEIDPNHMQSMMVLDPPPGGHRFRMVTIGDNDTLDCEHTGMEFEVTVSYVLDL